MFRSRVYFLFYLMIALAGLISCATFSDVKELKLGTAEFNVELTSWVSADNQKSLIIFPPTGGTNYLDKSYARYFARRGYNVYILNTWTGKDEVSFDLEIHQRFYSRSQKAIRLVLNQIQTQRPTPFVGLLGTSVGAIFSAVAATTLEGIDAVFFVVGGLTIPEVIVTSDQKIMQEAKQKRKEMFGFKTDLEYLNALDKAILLEPTRQGDLYKKKDYGMVLATQDTTVPAATQFKLKEFFRPRVTIEYDSSHFWAIVKSWMFANGDILDFFEGSAIAKNSIAANKGHIRD